MSDIILLDANVIKNITQGNSTAAEALKKLLNTPGKRVYIARAAFNEVVAGAPTPALAEHYRNLLQELKIEVAPAPSLKERANAYADNLLQEAKPSKGIPGPMPEYGGKADLTSGLKTRPADVFVAAEAKGLKAELWTLDKQFARQAAQQGVKIAPQSSIPSVGGVENPYVGRKLLGLKWKWTGWKPKINIKIRPVAILRGLGIAVVLGLIGSWLDARRDRQQIEEGLAELEPKINEHLNKLQGEIAKLQLLLGEGEKVYANIGIDIWWGVHEPFLPKGKYLYVPSIPAEGPSVWLGDIQITTKDISKQTEEKGFGTKTIHIIQSMEVAVYTKNELEMFRELSTKYLSANRRRRMSPSDEILLKEALLARARIIHTFGSDIWFLQDWNVGEDNLAHYADIEGEAEEAEPPPKVSMKL